MSALGSGAVTFVVVSVDGGRGSESDSEDDDDEGDDEGDYGGGESDGGGVDSDHD